MRSALLIPVFQRKMIDLLCCSNFTIIFDMNGMPIILEFNYIQDEKFFAFETSAYNLLAEIMFQKKRNNIWYDPNSL